MSKRICAACICESHLAQLIGDSETTEDCDFCDNLTQTIDLDFIVEECADVLDTYFEVTSETMAVIYYNRSPEGDSLRSVLDRLLGASDEVLEAIENGLHKSWYDASTATSKYDEDPWFIERKKRTGMYDGEWHKMEQSLRTEARLVNPTVNKTLEKVFGPLLHHVTTNGESAIVTIGDGTSIESLFRARAFPDVNMLEDALRHPARELGPHQPGKGRANRMNAQGISVFYGATLGKIAIAEVRPPVGSHVLVGEFRIVRQLRVLDLDKLRDLDISPSMSRFHPVTKEFAQRNAFLGWLSQRLEMPVMPERESDGYLVTQAVADFLATDERLDVDGIVFKSVQYQGEGADIGRNVALFNKASRVEQAEPGADGEVYHASVFEFSEDGEYFCPTIILKEPKDICKLGTMEGGSQDQRQITLRVGFDKLKICKVQSAEYRTEDTDVDAQPADLLG